MKLLILAVVIFLVGADDKYKVRKDIAEQWDNVIESQISECSKKSGEKEEAVRDMYKRGYYPNTSEFKHFLKCLGVTLNFVSEDGIFNEGSIKSRIKASDLDILEESAAAVKDEEDVAEKIYSFSLLFAEKVGKRYPHQH